MDKVTPLSTKHERRQTNDSLIDERGSTDEAYLNQTVSLENKTDGIVEVDRMKADQVRLERRNVADQALTGNNQSSDRYLQRERRAEDSAIKAERHTADTALENERSQRKSELRDLLVHAREATDKNLLNERIQTDSETVRSSGLLAAEKVAHTSTRAALTTREEFIAIVSHDLRNPIGAISSCADMLLTDTLHESAVDELKHWITFMKRNADTSLRLIGDILDMERIAEGRLGLEVGRHSLSILIRETVENNSQVALAKSILLRASLAMATDTFSFDKDRVAQVLSNLVSNALKFTPEGGSVVIDLQDKGSEVQVSIKDTGPGIAEDKQLHIFERFAQIQNKDRRGLGLGLYISKMFVELHHGKLWVESELGKGSVFYFTLPKVMSAGE